jgi:hypothetical protein
MKVAKITFFMLVATPPSTKHSNVSKMGIVSNLQPHNNEQKSNFGYQL